MKVCMIGTGYVGLVTGSGLAHVGHDVVCVDVVCEKVAKINRGEPTVHEPGLAELLRGVIAGGRLRATTQLPDAVRGADVSIVAVGTPNRNGRIDLAQVQQAAEAIGTTLRSMRGYPVVAVKSTVLPTTTDTVVRGWLERASGRRAGEFGLCMNPEFLREGTAVTDFLSPDRIVIGRWDRRSGDRLAELYAPFDCSKLLCNLRTAELIKYASNSLLACLVSYSNEMARMAELVGDIDTAEVLGALHLDRRFRAEVTDSTARAAQNGPGPKRSKSAPPTRVGSPASIVSFLWPGCGFGGSCLPKDVQALTQLARSYGEPMALLETVLAVNRTQPARMVKMAREALGSLAGRRIAVLGLAFKPDTDDLRESPAIAIVRELSAAGALVVVHDPVAQQAAREGPLASAAIDYAASVENALTGAEAALFVTAWKEYSRIPPEWFVELMRRPLVIDGRRLFQGRVLRRSGIEYWGVGWRPRRAPEPHEPAADGRDPMLSGAAVRPCVPLANG